MGVDHSISSGIGYVVVPDPDIVGDLYDGDEYEFLGQTLKAFPEVQYIVGGSYYEADNVHYAIVARGSGFNRIQDMAGIYPAETLATLNDMWAAHGQLREAYNAIMGEFPTQDPQYLVAGLWH